MTTFIDKKTGDEVEGNKPFYQVYEHNMKMMRVAIKENHLAAMLFFLLVEIMDKQNAIVISQNALMEILECKRTSLYTATKYLVANKYMEVYKSGPSNVYCINADIVWRQRAERKAFAKFDAKIYLTDSEQSAEVQKKIHTEYLKRVTGVEDRAAKQVRTRKNEGEKGKGKKKGATKPVSEGAEQMNQFEKEAS